MIARILDFLGSARRENDAITADAVTIEALRLEVRKLKREQRIDGRALVNAVVRISRMTSALNEIAASTVTNGTAEKHRRIAREALK